LLFANLTLASKLVLENNSQTIRKVIMLKLTRKQQGEREQLVMNLTRANHLLNTTEPAEVAYREFRFTIACGELMKFDTETQ